MVTTTLPHEHNPAYESLGQNPSEKCTSLRTYAKILFSASTVKLASFFHISRTLDILTCRLNVSGCDHDIAHTRSFFDVKWKANIIWFVDFLVIGCVADASQIAVGANFYGGLQTKETLIFRSHRFQPILGCDVSCFF